MSVPSGHWTGIRPFRSREELFKVLSLFSLRNGTTSVESVRNALLDYRKEREAARLQVTQRYLSTKMEKGKRRRKKPEMLTKAEQLIRILRATGLVVLDARGELVATEKNARLLEIRKRSPSEADAYFLGLLLNSRYKTYWYFLRTLKEKAELKIPGSTTNRDSNLREPLREAGFPTDIWSFFIMRDLFYDFSLLNFVNRGHTQIIFPLYDIGKTARTEYEHEIKVGASTISYWPKMSLDRFLTCLRDVYWQASGGYWNKMVEVVRLRELFSITYRVPERRFSELLVEAVKKKDQTKVVASYGSIHTQQGGNYIIKAITLPTNQMGLPYSLVRVGPSEPA